MLPIVSDIGGDETCVNGEPHGREASPPVPALSPNISPAFEIRDVGVTDLAISTCDA